MKESHERQLAAALTVALVMVAGIIGLGRLANSDLQAMVMTSVFFLALAVGIVLVIRPRRDLAIALGAPFLTIAGVAGLWLGLPLVTDRTVDEEVAVATSPQEQEQPGQASGQSGAPSGNSLLATGQFEAASHPGSGTASLIAVEDGSGVVTLTDFETDNGPDLLLYLVPADAPAGSAQGAVPLGALKGNRGDQQYVVGLGVVAPRAERDAALKAATTKSETGAEPGQPTPRGQGPRHTAPQSPLGTPGGIGGSGSCGRGWGLVHRNPGACGCPRHVHPRAGGRSGSAALARRGRRWRGAGGAGAGPRTRSGRRGRRRGSRRGRGSWRPPPS